MRIRKYKEKDKEAVLKLAKKIIYEIYNKKPNNIPDLENINKTYFIFLVFTDNKEIMGMIGLQHYKKNIIGLRRFYISKRYRNKGLGTKVLLKIEKIVKHHNYKKIMLKVYFKNKKAINFYRKNGFKRYKTKEGMICMEKIL